MARVGDQERDRTAVALRKHYLAGRLSEDELDERLDATLRARTRFDLMLAARSLPRHPPVEELVASTTHAVARALTAMLLASVWVLGSFVLLTAFAFSSRSTSAALAFLLAWLGMTWVVRRHWRHGA